ncbi:PREDICTED: B-cell receptor-associated protein 31-like isoform X3 [Branchiostoma belcheri]|uniref:Endoplasmic reticulum transmembrane protein n=2 Tax=Branchiostoma belcheri TaxID=7741 RepID=A0A6P4Y825_BRABE|nr:PREDICTED: B-cell receptor-associated protein 31-like isoform X3 [Branchiostoma belcheri]
MEFSGWNVEIGHPYIMTIQWTIVATFLYAEIGVCVLLCIPFISARRWQKIFKSALLNWFVQHGNLYFNVLIAILLLLFGDGIRESLKYGDLKDEEGAEGALRPASHMNIMMHLFRAQRNLYMSGFALFLIIVLRRLVTVISNTATLEAKSEAFEKQAKSATDAAEKLLEENEKLKKEGPGAENDAELEKLRDKVANKNKELDEAKDKLLHLEADLQAVKKQAQGVNTEYDRLLKEHSKLQEELEAAKGGDGDKKDD